MSLTKEDTILAIKISQAIQDFFDENKNIGTLTASDIFEVLEKNDSFIDKSTSKPLGFKQFLKKLNTNNALNLIPQTRAEARGKSVNYVFESTPGKTIRARKLVPVEKK